MLQWSIKSEVTRVHIWSLHSYCPLSHPEVASLLTTSSICTKRESRSNLIHTFIAPEVLIIFWADCPFYFWLTDVYWAAPGLLAPAAQAHAGHCHARHVGARSRSHGAWHVRDIQRDRVLPRVTVAVTDGDHVVITVTAHSRHCMSSLLLYQWPMCGVFTPGEPWEDWVVSGAVSLQSSELTQGSWQSHSHNNPDTRDTWLWMKKLGKNIYIFVSWKTF